MKGGVAHDGKPLLLLMSAKSPNNFKSNSFSTAPVYVFLFFKLKVNLCLLRSAPETDTAFEDLSSQTRAALSETLHLSEREAAERQRERESEREDEESGGPR